MSLERKTYSEYIIRHHGNPVKIIDELGASIEEIICGYAILSVPPENEHRLINYEEIEYFEKPFSLSFVLQAETERICAVRVRNDPRFNLSGEGVIIGIIDSGIDISLEDFRNPDGTTRVAALWDQSTDGDAPSGFLYGTEYTQEELNLALSENTGAALPGRDILGHGTAVAGIAAGGGSALSPNEIGVAPKASLAIVKLGSPSPPSTDILRGLKYLIDFAEKSGKPLCVNISYGTNSGAHNGSSLFELCISELARRYKTCVCISAGNEGDSAHHSFVSIPKNSSQYIPFSISENSRAVSISVYAEYAATLSVEVVSPSGIRTGVVTESAQYSAGAANIAVEFILPTPNQVLQEIRITVTTSSAVVSSGGDSSGVWYLNINNLSELTAGVNLWLPTEEEVGNRTAFLEPDSENTVTIPGTVFEVITVGGYNSGTGENAFFSGKGIRKPDIIAPAVNVISCRPGGGYDTFTGTSFASPFACGAAALMMQWGIVNGNDPFLYGQRIKAYIQKGATRYSYYSYPNPSFGYGILNLCNTMDYLLAEKNRFTLF